MSRKQDMIARNTATADPVNRAPSVFECHPSYVKLDSDTDEFFTSIGRSVRKKKPRGRTTAKTQAVDKTLKDLAQLLHMKEDYVPIFLKDEDMGIVDAAFAGGTTTLDATERAYYRQQFKKKLMKGLNGISVDIFGRNRCGRDNPTCIFVWKTPLFRGEDHAGKVQMTIESCRKILPNRLGEEAMGRFNNLLKGVSDIPADVHKAMCNYLFMAR